jgi:hypothetical protein
LDAGTGNMNIYSPTSIKFPSGDTLGHLRFSGAHSTQSSILFVCFVDCCLSFCILLLAIVLAVLRNTDSDCPKPGDKSCMRKGPASVSDKGNISVVICDTDIP